jgi:hypothetical protein
MRPLRVPIRLSLIRLFACPMLFFAVSFPSFGALGSRIAQVDASSQANTVRLTRKQAYTERETRSGNGTIIREYISPAGTVFAVAWQGPFFPEMRDVLGAYFDEYVTESAVQRTEHPGHWSLDLHEPELVVQMGGHARAYFGRAYDPTLLPPGVSADELW